MYKPENNQYLGDKDRCFLSEDPGFWEQIESRGVTVFFRPGDRTLPDSNCFVESLETGESFVGRIDKYGSHEKKVPPVIGAEIAVQIRERFCTKIGLIEPEDIQNSYREITDTESLMGDLAEKYPNLAAELDIDFSVTVYRVIYSKNLATQSA